MRITSIWVFIILVVLPSSIAFLVVYFTDIVPVTQTKLLELEGLFYGFEVSDFISILAVCIAGGSSVLTAVIFLKTYSRNRKSEQIKIAREVYDNINIRLTNYNDFVDKSSYGRSTDEHVKYIQGYLSVINDLHPPIRYFTFLVKESEIDDASIINYYKNGMDVILNLIEDGCKYIEKASRSNTAMDKPLAEYLPKDMSSTISVILDEVLNHRAVWGSAVNRGFWNFWVDTIRYLKNTYGVTIQTHPREDFTPTPDRHI